ncbi:murein L,D-transpeptidase catalytic domain-containing protein [Chryseobacterium sp.]|uniref:murein L,D-transpeptidase catalytic domain-containing protein n=1 Tax=Chryseobacterium sp. TaxID=1871047 RepID=UPI0024E261F3|nr:murein L,D-transpeptidase catalytic domain family protein [Chryseobacterium sp.]
MSTKISKIPKFGDNGKHVAVLQQILTNLGFGITVQEIDGGFGPKTKNAILAFQKSNGMSATGTIDNTTQYALNLELDEDLYPYNLSFLEGINRDKPMSALEGQEYLNGMIALCNNSGQVSQAKIEAHKEAPVNAECATTCSTFLEYAFRNAGLDSKAILFNDHTKYYPTHNVEIMLYRLGFKYYLKKDYKTQKGAVGVMARGKFYETFDHTFHIYVILEEENELYDKKMDNGKYGVVYTEDDVKVATRGFWLPDGILPELRNPAAMPAAFTVTQENEEDIFANTEELPVKFKTLENVPSYEWRESNLISFTSGMRIDADGSPRAYHRDSSLALDYLGNAGHSGKWWALATDNKQESGNPLIQKNTDPAPGYYISMTSLQDRTKNYSDPNRYVNSEEIPYIVLPGEFSDDFSLGDIALVINKDNNKQCFAIFADHGPKGKLGEGSVYLAKQLGINGSAKSGGKDSNVQYILIKNSGNGTVLTNEEIQQIGAEKLHMGGINKIADYRFPTNNKKEIALRLAETIGQRKALERLFNFKNAQGSHANFWAVVDFNKPSSEERLFIFNLIDESFKKYLVAHGKNSGDKYAKTFSNVNGSNCSSLGVYKTGETYTGKHGKSLRIDGLENSNSNVRERAIVIHSADYVVPNFENTGRAGRSEGCFAVHPSVSNEVIENLKEGSYFLAWYQGD